MHHFFKFTLPLLICIAFSSVPVQAQWQLNAIGSYVVPGGPVGPTNNKLGGGGVALRYFLNPNVAIGVTAQYLTKGLTYADIATRNSNRFVAAQAEYFFTRSALQPYMGVEAGLFANRYRTEVPSHPLSPFEGRNNWFSVGPKVGLQYMITPSIGLNTEATYKLIVDRGSSIDQALLLNGGLVLRWGRH